MRAAKAVVDHFTSVPSVTRAGAAEKLMLAASPNFWKGVAKELFTKDGDQGSVMSAKLPVSAGKRRGRSSGRSMREIAQSRHESRIAAAGGDHDVTPRGGRMTAGDDD